MTKKPPERLHRELKARYWRILDEASSVAEARRSARARRRLPATRRAMAVIERDLDALVCHLRFPSQHRKRIRSTNLIRCDEDGKVIGITVVNVKWPIERDGGVRLPLRVPAEDLARALAG